MAVALPVDWVGYPWRIRDYPGSPNTHPDAQGYDPGNVFVQDGKLHLKITKKADGKWYSAEVYTERVLDYSPWIEQSVRGFGTYTWEVESPINALDKNVVLGLFTHEGSRKCQYTNEIDIEICKWGQDYSGNPRIQYCINPQNAGTVCDPPTTYPYRVIAEEPQPTRAVPTIHTLVWTSQQIRYEARYKDTGVVFASRIWPGAGWNYPWSAGHGEPTVFDPLLTIPQMKMKTFMDLWCYAPPSDGKEVEIVISQFTFSEPASLPEDINQDGRVNILDVIRVGQKWTG